MSSSATRSRLLLAFAAIYIVWGSTYLGIRVAVESLPPFLMASLRFCASGFLMMAFLRLTRGPLHVTARQVRDNAIVGGFLLLGGNGLVSWAEQFLPSGITALIIGAQPMVLVLTEWAWVGGKRPSLATFLGLLLGFAGVAWLAAPWEQSGAAGEIPLRGVLAVLAACVSWAIGSIYGRNAKSPADPFVSSGLQMLFGSAFLALTALVRGEWSAWVPSQVTAASWGAVVYLTLVGSLVGFSCFAWLMKHSTPARVSTYAYVNPVVAVFLGWLVLHEPVGSRTLAASAVIIVAVVIVTVQRRRGA